MTALRAVPRDGRRLLNLPASTNFAAATLVLHALIAEALQCMLCAGLSRCNAQRHNTRHLNPAPPWLLEPTLIRRQAWRPALRREQRDQLAERQRRSLEAGSSAKGKASATDLVKGADGRPVHASPFSLYSDPLAALDTSIVDPPSA